MRIFRVIFFVGLIVLVACATAPGDPENGRELYSGEMLIASGDAPACIMCHPVMAGESAQVMGPNLSNVGNRAGHTVPGQSAEEYLRLAIVEPDAYLAGGFQEGIHYRDYGRVLTQRQVNDLVAYMLTLTSGRDE